MAVFALWSAPRARSTAFFRSMAERGDLTVLHEPFGNLKNYGETDVDGQTFDSPAALLAWLRETQGSSVFLKDTMDHQYDDVRADRRFLAEPRHAFLIRCPEEIASSYYALFPPMTINAIGMERLCEMQAAIGDAGGNPPVVIDSDDLVTRPAATMAAYCAAVGCPSVRRRSPGTGVSSPSGAGLRAGTRTRVTARASSGSNANTGSRPRTPRSWRGTPLTTGPFTNSCIHSGWMSRPGRKRAAGQAESTPREGQTRDEPAQITGPAWPQPEPSRSPNSHRCATRRLVLLRDAATCCPTRCGRARYVRSGAA